MYSRMCKCACVCADVAGLASSSRWAYPTILIGDQGGASQPRRATENIPRLWYVSKKYVSPIYACAILRNRYKVTVQSRLPKCTHLTACSTKSRLTLGFYVR